LILYGSIRGRFAPGFMEINGIFGDMWRDAAKNREKWGCKLASHFTIDLFYYYIRECKRDVNGRFQI